MEPIPAVSDNRTPADRSDVDVAAEVTRLRTELAAERAGRLRAEEELGAAAASYEERDRALAAAEELALIREHTGRDRPDVTT